MFIHSEATVKHRDPRPSFNDIEKFPYAPYAVDVSWRQLEAHIALEVSTGLDLAPDFQRGHVWTDAQASAYIEYALRGGRSGTDLYFNCPRYTRSQTGSYVIVDGLQRLTAVRRFLRGEVPVFGRLIGEYRDRPDRITTAFRWHVTELETRAEVLRFYLDFNAGGTPHAASEIERVRGLLAAEVA